MTGSARAMVSAGQHRCDDGERTAADGPDQGHRPAGDRHPDPPDRHPPEHPHRRRRQRRVQRPACSSSSPRWAAAYVSARYHVDSPTVALLSIGEEPTKGNALVKETHALSAELPGINFVGNVEGRDLLPATADVVVTDGFTGNVALKTLEGSLKFFMGALFSVFSMDEETKRASEVHRSASRPARRGPRPRRDRRSRPLGCDGCLHHQPRLVQRTGDRLRGQARPRSGLGRPRRPDSPGRRRLKLAPALNRPGPGVTRLDRIGSTEKFRVTRREGRETNCRPRRMSRRVRPTAKRCSS